MTLSLKGSSLIIKLKIIVWFLFFLTFIYINNKYKYNINVFYSLLFSSVLVYQTLIKSLSSIYKYGKPKLLDWFRITTFYVLIISFYNSLSYLGKDTQSMPDFIINEKSYLGSLLIIFIGLVAFQCAELLFEFFKYNIKRTHVKVIFKNQKILYLISGFVLFIQFFLLINNFVGYGSDSSHNVSNYSYLIQTISGLSLILLSIISISFYILNNKSLKTIFYLFFIFQILFGFLSGMKESVISPFIIVIIPYLISGKKIPFIRLFLILILLLIVYPVNDNYRTVVKNNVNIDRVTAIQIALTKTVNGEFGEILNEGTNSYSSRLDLFPFLMYAYENELLWKEYKNMNRYIYIPVSFLPRGLITTKPKSDSGSKLNDIIYDFDYNSITPTTYGWSYFEGGYIYVFITFLLFGLVITYLEKYLNLDNLKSIILYSILLLQLLKVENDIYFYLCDIVQKIFLIYFISKIFFKTSHK
jgi:hypothetical protein